MGLDLGKKRDFSALVILERPECPNYLTPRREDGRVELAVRHVQRWALGTPYTLVVEQVAAMTRSHVEVNGFSHLTVDATGVGVAVEEALRNAQGGWRGMTAVTITGGDRARQVSGFGVGEHWNVPRKDLLSVVQLLLEKGELKIAAEMKETRTLVRELVRMRASKRAAEGSSVETEEHDDVVMALTLGCWQATRAKAGLGMQRLL